MKNRIQLLLAAALAFSAAPVFAADCDDDGGCPTNKTFLMPRSDGVNLALEKSAGWPNLENRCLEDEDDNGTSFQGVFFITESTKSEDFARYFLFPSTATPNGTTVSTNACGDCDDDCGDDCASVQFGRFATSATGGAFITTPAANAARGAGSLADMDLGFLVHVFNSGAVVPTAVVGASTDTQLKLCPKHKAIGATFNLHKESKCLKGMYFEVAVPVVNVKNNLNMSTSGTDDATSVANLASYLQGNYSVAQGAIDGTGTITLNSNAQAALTNALMTSCDLGKTGVADVDFLLGYKFLDEEKYYAAVSLGVTIPVGNKSKGIYLFEPMVGNGGHVGFGVGLDSRFKFWESECCSHSFAVNLAMNYRYLFKNHETRTLGLTGQNFGQYMLLLDRTVEPGAQQLIPAANITTMRVDVTPGSQFDGILSLNYNWKRFAFDLGYNLFFREHEKVRLNCGTPCRGTEFVDGRWAVATRNADMSLTTGATATTPMELGTGTVNPQPDYVYRYVNRADLDTSAAETKSLFTNKLFAGLGFWTKACEMPMLVGVGGHYEWADCGLINNWGFNARLGVGF